MDVAIIIGCSSYDDAQIQPLRYADSDVASFAQAATATCGFPASSVTAFSSSSAEPSLQPTRRNILRFLSQGANVSAGEYVERLYFFFSGHGFKSVQDGTDYLLTRDSIANYPELNSIPLATVVSYLNGWGARNVVLFLDACRPFLEARKARQTGRWKRVDTSDLCPPGMVTFASCQTGQASYESEKYHAGIFTAALVEAFSDVGRRSTVREVDGYLSRRVPEIARESGTPGQDPLSRLEPIGVERLVLVTEALANRWRPSMAIGSEQRTHLVQRSSASYHKTLAAIDFGTTYSAIAVVDDEGRPTLVPSPGGNRLIPSAVSFLDDLHYVVGWPALERLNDRPDMTIRHMKRRLGTTDHFEVNGRTMTPEQATSLVLASLRRNAEEYTGRSMSAFLAAVPANFSSKQINALAKAFELADMPIRRFIGEPEAAGLLLSQLERDTMADPSGYFALVADLGGGTFDVTTIEAGVSEGALVTEVLATAGDNELGGMDYDDALEAHVRALLWEQNQVPWQSLSQWQLGSLRRQVERVKTDLESRDASTIVLENVESETGDFLGLTFTVTRDDFRTVTAHLGEKVRRVVSSAITQTGSLWRSQPTGSGQPKFGKWEYDCLFLAGQGSKIFAVEEILRSMVQCRTVESRLQELAVATGLAYQAGVLTGGVDDVLLLAVRQRGVGIAVTADVGKNDYLLDLSRPSDVRGAVLVAPQTTVPTKRSGHVLLKPPATADDVSLVVVEQPYYSSETCEVIGSVPLGRVTEEVRLQVTVDVNADLTTTLSIESEAAGLRAVYVITNPFFHRNLPAMTEAVGQHSRRIPVLEEDRNA